MGRSIFEEVIDQWPQDRPDIRVNWPRVALALVPAAMMLLALGFKGGQSISVTPSAAAKVPSAPEAESTLRFSLTYRGQLLEVEISPRSTTYSLREGAGLVIRHEDEAISLDRANPTAARPTKKPLRLAG